MDDIKSSPIYFCPYIGLQSYTDAERDYFFGRERDIRIISSNLYAASLTVLYGSSGVGKSSVLQAGVAPRLRSSPRTAVVIFNEWSGKSLLATLKAKCLDAIATADGKNVHVNTSFPLDEFLFAATQAFGGTLIIILDQFEEYFLYHPETDKKNTFDAEFARAVNREEVDVNFLISMREDALSKLDRFRSRIPNMLGNALRLRHLDVASARDAIRKPLEVYSEHHPNEPSISAEDVLVEELIHEIRAGKLLIGQGGRGTFEVGDATAESSARIEAPFLQLVLTRLWDEETRQGSRVLRFKTLNALGGAERIVRTHMDAAMSTLSPEEQETAANIFRFLVTPSGTKIAYSIADLEYYAKPVQSLESVLQKLAQGDVRIIRPVTSTSEPGILRYEIFHDVLATAVLDWRARYEAGKDLLQVRISLGRQLRSMFWWVALGILIDLVWPVFGFFSLTALCFLPLGGLAVIPGLRKIRPPLSSGQILLVVITWIGASILSTLILVFAFTALSNSFNELPEVALLGLEVLGFTLKIFVGPLAGLLAYWRISKEREHQLFGGAALHSPNSPSLSKKYIEHLHKMQF